MQIETLLATLRANPELAKLRLGGRPLMEAVDEIAMVGVEGTGEGVRPVARNAAAQRLLDEPGMADALRGALQLNASRPHGGDLQTLMLPVGAPGDPIQFDADTDVWGDQDAPIWDEFAGSPRRDAFVAGKVAISLHQQVAGASPEEGARLLAEAMPDLVEQLRPMVEDWRTNYLWAGQASRGVALVSPEVVDGWRALVRAGRDPDWRPSDAARLTSGATLSTIFHELEHVRSFPPLDDDYERQAWLEEGTASVLADWPSERTRLAEAAGVPDGAWKDDPTHDYATYSAIVSRLLDAAGVDPTAPGSKMRADALLQGPNIDQVPGALASAVAGHLGRGDDPGYVARLRRAIENGRGTPSHLRHIERVLERA